MKKTVTAVIKTIREMQKGNAEKRLAGEFLAYDDDRQTLRMRFPVLEWELNSRGVMHGMVVSGILDDIMGKLSNDITRELYAPSGSMYIDFIAPVRLGEHLIVEARVVYEGKRLIRMHSEARLESSGKLAAQADGTYIPVTFRPIAAQDTAEENQARREEERP